MKIELSRAGKLRGKITPPPDKSISHRAIILSSIAKGRSVIRNFLRAADTLSSLNAMRALGINITGDKEIIVEGKGLYGLKEPSAVLDCGNSGTTMRLLAGVLSGTPFFSVLTGDESLRKRPMGRIIIPLRQMGAVIMAREADKYPPVAIKGGGLDSIRYEMPLASAQVKSAVLLAGLYADGVTEVIEPVKSRDHTERMLPAYGVDVKGKGCSVKVRGGTDLTPVEFSVPGDFSSAAFFIAASLLIKGSELVVKTVGLNPTRTGLLDVLKKMGAAVSLENMSDVSGEPVADLHCRYSELKAVDIGAEIIPSLIDEFPVLCVIASQAEGTTTIRGAGELRVKESDRIKAMAEGLKRMGVEVHEYKDGLSIKGNTPIKGSGIDSYGDHRVAMAFSIAALIARGKTAISSTEAVDISFPGFFRTLRRLTG